MKIAMMASEAAPFVKTGGLGDVAGSLPAALTRAGAECIVMVPKYSTIKSEYTDQMEHLTWRESYVGIFRLKSRRKKLQIYFIDNDYYFGARGTVYGDFDDGERFAYYSKAVMAALYYIDFKPEILHCHDWETAMGIVYCRALYGTWCPEVKTVFTIHNVEYQGWADPTFFDNTLGLPEEYRCKLNFDGAVNMMKGAIETADLVTTVSETYARELMYPYYAHGLDGILARNAWKLSGITNGINMELFGPDKSTGLAQKYTPKTRKAGKTANKLALQRAVGLDEDPDCALAVMVTRLASHKGIDLLCYIGERLMQRRVQLLVIGTGEEKYEWFLQYLQDRFRGRAAACLEFDPQKANLAYAGADIYLMPSKSEPCGLSQIIAMRFGTVPVVNATGGLKDTVWPYDPSSEQGRGFTFQSYNADDFLAAIDRSLQLFYDEPEKWARLSEADMSIDSSWKLPAQEYMELYKKAIG